LFSWKAASWYSSNLIGLYVSHDKKTISIFSLFLIFLSINDIYIFNLWFTFFSHHSSLNIIVIKLFWFCVMNYGLFISKSIFFYHLTLIDCELWLRSLYHFTLFLLLSIFYLEFNLFIITKILIIFIKDVFIIIYFDWLFFFQTSANVLIKDKLFLSTLGNEDILSCSWSYLIK
jgi:hypothetical protein